MTDITSPTGQVYFARDELASPDTGEVRLASGFADALEALRAALGKPMIVTSCCRSTAHNRDVGGHSRSLHIYDDPHHGLGGCAAIDIAVTDSRYRAELVRLALTTGWSVGVGDGFVHLDRRDLAGLPEVLFTYY